MQELNITTKTQGLPMEVVCNILTIALQEKDADLQRMQAKIDALESRLENNCIYEITVEGYKLDCHKRCGESVDVPDPDIDILLRFVPDEVIQATIAYVVGDVGEMFDNSIQEGGIHSMTWDDETDTTVELSLNGIHEIVTFQLEKVLAEAIEYEEEWVKVAIAKSEAFQEERLNRLLAEIKT